MTNLYVVMLVVTGLSFGSFVNALVWRLHEQAKPKKKRIATDQELSIVSGRSICPDCQHRLAWYDLLPVISWLQLGGKCRYCRRPISMQYPLAELLTAALFVYSYWYWPNVFNTHGITLFVLWLMFMVGFMALSVYDLRCMLLPNRIVFPLIGLAVMFALVDATMNPEPLQALLGSLWGVICIAGLFYGLFQISKGSWIGGGDVKLAVILGLLVGGPGKALLVIFVASLLGSVISIPLLLRGKTKARVPFGPFLMLATVIVYLFGTNLINWYQRLVL